MVDVVIVTGSRMWSSKSEIAELMATLTVLDPEWVVHGGAKGADSQAERWAKTHGRKSKVYYPDYERLGKGAPLKRNVLMLEDHPEAVVVACPRPDSRGTYYTMKAAVDRGMDVITIEHDREAYG
jgi:hypothetical protein